jgi:hypothetical protein
MTYQRLLSSYILDGHNLFRLDGRSRKPHHNSTCHSAQCSSVVRLHTYNSWYIRISSSVLLSQVVHIFLSALPFAEIEDVRRKNSNETAPQFPTRLFSLQVTTLLFVFSVSFREFIKYVQYEVTHSAFSSRHSCKFFEPSTAALL